MNRVTRTHIQGIVNMVFDLCEKEGIIIHPRYFGICIEDWIIRGITPKTLPGIPNERLPIPEVNAINGFCLICDNYMIGPNKEGEWKCYECELMLENKAKRGSIPGMGSGQLGI